MQARVVEQDLGTISERELAVAEVLAVLVLVLDLLFGHGVFVAATLQRRADAHRVHLGHEGREVGADGDKLPLEVIEVEVANHAANHGGDVFEVRGDGGVLRLDRGGRSRDGLEDGSKAHGGGHGLGGLLLIDLRLEALERLEGLGGNLAGLGVRELGREAVDGRHELGEEGLGLARVVDELGHVVDDDGDLALDLSLLLLAAAEEDGHSDGERRGVDRLDEDGGRELVDSLGDLLGRLDGLDELGAEGLDVPVLARLEGILERLGGGRLDLGLGVPHRLRDDGHGDGERLGEGEAVLLGELAEEGERPHLDLPLGLADAIKEHLLDRADGPAAADVHEGGAGLLGEGADLGLLVREGLEDLGEEGHDNGLDGAADDAREGLDGNQAILHRLVVPEELGDGVHGAGLGQNLGAGLLDNVREVVGSELGHVVGELALELGDPLLHLADILGVAGDVTSGKGNVVERVRLLKPLLLLTSGGHCV
mmetsp:Transcript_18397/g.42605  ORF Transcript_18397/g.42605 Transcript_18397/m.42605 type:complete len:482 (-) Transcript_18397:32-1477(-)